MLAGGVPDELFPPGSLEPYWEAMLKDFPDHPLHTYKGRISHSVPILLWGDEGQALRRNWLLATWWLARFSVQCTFLLGLKPFLINAMYPPPK